MDNIDNTTDVIIPDPSDANLGDQTLEDPGYRVISDIWHYENIVANTGYIASKNLIIDTLRKVFRRDRYYAFKTDVFGFPKTPSEYNLDPATGLIDNDTTRIFIGSTYRYDIVFRPALIVKLASSQYVPISFNQNMLGVVYRDEVIRDGYGNYTQIYTPAYNTLVGAWDQKIEVKIVSESEADREELTDIVQTVLMGPRRLELQNEGLFIRSISTSGEQEEQYANDYLYMATVDIDCRSEWKCYIPINNIVDKIMFCFDFGYTDASGNPYNFPEVQPQFNINETIDLVYDMDNDSDDK